MDELLRQTPKTLLALIAIVIGYALIIGFNPPRSVCDEQIDVFLASQQAFLKNQSEKVIRSAADEMYELCKNDNGPGGCFDYFLNVKSMIDGLERIPKNCATTVASNEQIKKWVLKSITLLAQIAWGGDSSSAVYVSTKLSWLDASDFRLYCRLKSMAIKLFGDDGFSQYRDSLLSTLPGADKLTREQKWSRSIFSSSCE